MDGHKVLDKYSDLQMSVWIGWVPYPKLRKR